MRTARFSIPLPASSTTSPSASPTSCAARITSPTLACRWRSLKPLAPCLLSSATTRCSSAPMVRRCRSAWVRFRCRASAMKASSRWPCSATPRSSARRTRSSRSNRAMSLRPSSTSRRFRRRPDALMSPISGGLNSKAASYARVCRRCGPSPPARHRGPRGLLERRARQPRRLRRCASVVGCRRRHDRSPHRGFENHRRGGVRSAARALERSDVVGMDRSPESENRGPRAKRSFIRCGLR